MSVSSDSPVPPSIPRRMHVTPHSLVQSSLPCSTAALLNKLEDRLLAQFLGCSYRFQLATLSAWKYLKYSGVFLLWTMRKMFRETVRKSTWSNKSERRKSGFWRVRKICFTLSPVEITHMYLEYQFGHSSFKVNRNNETTVDCSGTTLKVIKDKLCMCKNVKSCQNIHLGQSQG